VASYTLQRLIIASAIACALGALPSIALGDAGTAAPATSASPPVTINSCGPIINDKNATTNVLGVPVPASMSSGIQIEFVNTANLPATLVNFAVDSAGDHFVIRDVGTFSPGVSIKHQYRSRTAFCCAVNTAGVPRKRHHRSQYRLTTFLGR